MGHFLSPVSPTVEKLSNTNSFVLLRNLYLWLTLSQASYDLCYCTWSFAPQYLLYFILSTLQFHSPYFTEGQRYRGVREVCAWLNFHYVVDNEEVPRASQEIDCKAGSKNAPRTLETCVQSLSSTPCLWGQTILFIVLRKFKTFLQKRRQMTSFTIFYIVVPLWLHSGSDVFVWFCLFALEWKGTAIKYKWY